MHADFDELCALVERKGPDLNDLICHIFATSIDDDDDDNDDDGGSVTNVKVVNEKIYYDSTKFNDAEMKKSLLDQPEPYEKIFPELFLY